MEKEKREYNVSAKDVSKALIDLGIHPPTMYFPNIVHEALIIEPNETESKETLDFAIQTFRDIYHSDDQRPGTERCTADHTGKAGD